MNLQAAISILESHALRVEKRDLGMLYWTIRNARLALDRPIDGIGNKRCFRSRILFIRAQRLIVRDQHAMQLCKDRRTCEIKRIGSRPRGSRGRQRQYNIIRIYMLRVRGV